MYCECLLRYYYLNLLLHETDEVNHFWIMFNIGALLTLVSLVGF